MEVCSVFDAVSREQFQLAMCVQDIKKKKKKVLWGGTLKAP